MRKVLFVLLVVALMPTAAQAIVVGTWSDVPGATDDTWTMTLTPEAGETMYGFDLGVYDTNYFNGGDSPGTWVWGNDFANEAGETCFLLRKSQGATTNINSNDWVDAGSIGGTLAAVQGGIYYGKWTSGAQLAPHRCAPRRVWTDRLERITGWADGRR